MVESRQHAKKFHKRSLAGVPYEALFGDLRSARRRLYSPQTVSVVENAGATIQFRSTLEFFASEAKEIPLLRLVPIAAAAIVHAGRVLEGLEIPGRRAPDVQ